MAKTSNDALLYDDGEQVDGAWREVTMLWPSPDPDPAGEVDPLAPIAILTARGEVVESFASTTGPFIPDLRARWLLEDVARPRWYTLGVMLTCVVPSRHGFLSSSTTRPGATYLSCSSENGGRR